MYKHGGDIYKYKNSNDFSANINFFGIPESVKEAVKNSIESCIHYPDVECRELTAAIRKKDGIENAQIFCGNGAADVIFALVLAKKPRKALIMAPGFQEYEQALRSIDCEIEYHMLLEENDFRLDDTVLEKITDETDMIFVCNPNNPTGHLVERELLLQILDKCEKTNTLLVVDECFNEFLECPKENSILEYTEKSNSLFILKAFTKIFAIPGLRLGYGITLDEELVKRMLLVSQPWRVSVPAQAAGVTACNEMEFVTTTKTKIQEEKNHLLSEMKDLGIKTYGSNANYIFFKEKETLWDELLEKGFLLRDCSNYKGLYKGFYRIAVKSREDNEALIKAFRELRR